MAEPDEIERIRERIQKLEGEVVAAGDRLKAISEELWQLRMALPAAESRETPRPPEPTPVPKVEPSAERVPQSPPPIPPTIPSPPPEAIRAEPRQSPDFISRARAFIAERIGHVPLEDFIGTNLLLKVGVFILVAGLTYFMKVAYDDFFGPWLKLATLTALSIAALAGGHLLHRRPNLRLFGLWIVAGGSMLLYYCVYAAHGVQATRVIPTDKSFLAYLLLLPTAGFLIWNSLRYDSEAMTGGIYFLAFFAISLNETGGLNYTFAMTALVFLAGGLIIILFLRRWKYLTGLGLLATYGNFFLYSRGLPRDTGGFVLRGSDADPTDYFLRGIAYLAIYWIIFTVSAFTMRSETRRERRMAASVHIGNAFTFLALVFYTRPEPTDWGSFIVTTVMGTLYIACAILGRYLKKDFMWTSSLLIGCGLLLLAPALKFSEYGLTFAWLVQSSVLIILGFALNEKYLRYTGYVALILKMGSFFLLPTGDFLHSGDGPDASLWAFDLNRGLLYVFMIIAFLGLRHTGARFTEKLQTPDRIARHAFGVLTILTMVFLAYHVLLAPHGAFLLVPCAIFMAGLYALHLRLGLDESPFFAPILIVLALVSALPLVFTPGDPDRLLRGFATLFSITAGAGLLFAYELRFVMPRYAMGRPGVSRIRARVVLWAAVISAAALAMHYTKLEAVNTLVLLLAAGMVILNRFTGFGLPQAMALLLHAFFTATYFYFSAKGTPEEGPIFLWNAGAAAGFLILLLSAANIRAVHARFLRGFRGKGHLPGIIRIQGIVLLSFLNIQLLEHLLDAPYTQAGLAAFALASAGMGFLMRDRYFLLMGAAFQLLALLAGPIYWIFTAPEIESDAFRLSLSVIGPSLALTALAFIAMPLRAGRDGERGGDASSPTASRLPVVFAHITYTVALIGWFAYVYLLVPALYQPSGFALLTAANYYLIRRFSLRGLYPMAPVPFLLTCVSFAHLLYTFSGPDTQTHEALRALTGLVPLGLLAVSLVLHGALRPHEKLTKFQTVGAAALLLGFVLLTMTIVRPGYWSLAWVVEAFLLIAAGLRWNFRVLRYGAMGLIVIALGKLALWDVRNLDEIARIAVLIGTGILFVTASYLYAKFRTRLFPETEEELKDRASAEDETK